MKRGVKKTPKKEEKGKTKILLLLRPPPLPQRQFPTLPLPLPRDLRTPGIVLPQPRLSIRSIVKVNLRDSRLDQRPNPPIKPRHAPKPINLLLQRLHLSSLVHTRDLGISGLAFLEDGIVRLDVFRNKLAALRAGREHAEVAVETAPFGEVVGEVEGGWGRGRVFVVDEGDGWVGGFVGGELGLGEDDDVPAEEVAVGEDELD